MVKWFVVFVALGSVMAFAQMGGRGTPGTSQPANNPGASDTSPTNEPQMKSIDQVLHDDARLSGKLQDMLPATVTPQQACAGFKTLEQCVTAIHLAQNLKLPFADLKAKTTGKGSVGLQKAITQMAANANAKDEMKKAKKQAADDMKGTSLFGQRSLQDQMVQLSKPLPA
ncbi:MAG: hypothetical protein WAM78_03335 [Candidatus Sulfotelmatobacter sp.]